MNNLDQQLDQALAEMGCSEEQPKRKQRANQRRTLYMVRPEGAWSIGIGLPHTHNYGIYGIDAKPAVPFNERKLTARLAKRDLACTYEVTYTDGQVRMLESFQDLGELLDGELEQVKSARLLKVRSADNKQVYGGQFDG